MQGEDSDQQGARIAICEGRPLVREGMLSVLARAPDLEVVGVASDGEAAVELAGRDTDVILIDLAMDGFSATRRIKFRHPEVHVLVLTSFESEADVLGAVEAGASGYVLEDAPPEDLFKAIRMTVAGQSPFSPRVASRLVERMRRPESATLDSREIEALRLAAQGETNKEIANKLWVSIETVKNRLERAYVKLGANGRTNAVALAVERGLIRASSPRPLKRPPN